MIKMLDPSRTKIRRLAVWLALNLVIFVACYLNYRLQLKHRYLYRTLSAGLCLSRAAAMVINFNLILVWIPMCKYTLTKLAVLACSANSNFKAKLAYLTESGPFGGAGTPAQGEQASALGCHIAKQTPTAAVAACGGGNKSQGAKPAPLVSICRKLARKVGLAVRKLNWKVRCHLCQVKISTINSFLVAVDHATSLHTICATTITLASVIHTVAHLMNVINFSNNYDPLLDNLNMAAHRGQNPLQLLVSVPGITGCLMIIILFLMSLSSISAIRNSSFDLFQIFHRLSVLFVILLILHPSSHVLKEQVNVDRHNPDICHDKMILHRDEILATRAENSTRGIALRADALAATRLHSRVQSIAPANASSELQDVRHQLHPSDHELPLLYNETSLDDVNDLKRDQRKRDINISNNEESDEDTVESESPRDDERSGDDGWREATSPSPSTPKFYIDSSGELKSRELAAVDTDEPCLDLMPRFVPQSSLCWYVLGAGLSCYILDLLLRRLRRSRSPIELLDARADGEGNLMELVLSNNHKRFAHWLPGQFVYLNCPQIAAYEWHPFTISSMDNRTRQFTLHIKAGGDWTRKLRDELEIRQAQQAGQQPWLAASAVQPATADRPHEKQNSMSLFSQAHKCSNNDPTSAAQRAGSKIGFGQAPSHFRSLKPFGRRYTSVNVVANLDCYDHRTGQSQVQCRKLVCLAHADNGQTGKRQQGHLSNSNSTSINTSDCRHMTRDCVRIDLNNVQQGSSPYLLCTRSLDHPHGSVNYGSSLAIAGNLTDKNQQAHANLDLFIDGPFHSPFERLLEQQVSVCIANGVGWTAFSSVFEQIINNQIKATTDKDAWWSQWRNYVTLRPTTAGPAKSLDASLGLEEGTRKLPGSVTPSTTVDINQKLSLDTKLHIMIIVTTIEQLKPFYHIAMRYFDHLGSEIGGANSTRQSPVKDITAFITRSTKREADVIEFCRRERLNLDENTDDDTLAVNDTFLIRFGKPKFDAYLCNFSNIYKNKRKISIYCCGSYQVKRTVEEICRNLNKQSRSETDRTGPRPTYYYHEENF